MHCRKETCATWFGMFVSGVHSCHSCEKCQASTPDQKLQVPERDSMLYQFCIMLASSHPFVAAAEKKTCLMQRSRGFGHGVVVANIFKVQWLCSQLCYATAAHPWTVVKIELLATVGWTRGCQPFSCRCSQNVTHCRKEICSTCLFKTCLRHPFRPFLFEIQASTPYIPYCKWSMYSFSPTAKNCCFDVLTKWWSCILG